MKIHKRPDLEKLHIVTAMLRVWLIDVCVWLCRFCNGRPPRFLRLELRRELAEALRDTRMLVFLLAVSRMDIPIGVARIERPLSAPLGCRRAREGGEGRVFRRGVRLRGASIAARFAELRAIFANLGRTVRLVLRYLKRRPRGVAIVLATALAERLCGVADVAATCVDSS